jgi:hypothetical protein
MSKEQLLNLIAHKGNERKKALYESAKFQTFDCQNTDSIRQNIE